MKLTLEKSLLRVFIFLSFSLLLFGCKKETRPPSPPVANAGESQTIQLPKASLILTGSGGTHNGSITGYLWSLVSGPNVPVITQPGSATTSVTDFSAGTYIFQLLVTDEAALTDVDTTIITINAALVQTLTLQPSSNDNEKHLWWNGSIDGSTHATELDAGTWTAGGGVAYVRGIFKFDFSSIPSNATILSAKLSLFSNPTPLNGDLIHANSGTGNSMFIRRITSNWTPATTFWNNQPTATSLNQVSIPHTDQSSLDLIDIDVQNLISDMLTNANYGFQIILQNEAPYNLRDFCSSTYSDASKHPKLIVTYQQ